MKLDNMLKSAVFAGSMALSAIGLYSTAANAGPDAGMPDAAVTTDSRGPDAGAPKLTFKLDSGSPDSYRADSRGPDAGVGADLPRADSRGPDAGVGADSGSSSDSYVSSDASAKTDLTRVDASAKTDASGSDLPRVDTGADSKGIDTIVAESLSEAGAKADAGVGADSGLSTDSYQADASAGADSGAKTDLSKVDAGVKTEAGTTPVTPSPVATPSPVRPNLPGTLVVKCQPGEDYVVTATRKGKAELLEGICLNNEKSKAKKVKVGTKPYCGTDIFNKQYHADSSSCVKVSDLEGKVGIPGNKYSPGRPQNMCPPKEICVINRTEKADKTYVDSKLTEAAVDRDSIHKAGLQRDAATNEALGKKADTTYVDDGLDEAATDRDSLYQKGVERQAAIDNNGRRISRVDGKVARVEGRVGQLEAEKGLEFAVGAVYLSGEANSETGVTSKYGALVQAVKRIGKNVYLGAWAMVASGSASSDTPVNTPALKGPLEDQLKLVGTQTNSGRETSLSGGAVVGTDNLIYNGSTVQIGAEAAVGGGVNISETTLSEQSQYQINGKPVEGSEKSTSNEKPTKYHGIFNFRVGPKFNFGRFSVSPQYVGEVGKDTKHGAAVIMGVKF